MTLFNVLIALSASLAIVFGLAADMLMLSIFKPLTTVLIGGALVVHRRRLSAGVFRMFLVALLACLVGDILLLNEARFVAGLSAFLLAHVLFIRLFVMVGGWSWNLRPLMVLLLLVGPTFWYLQPHLGDLKLPVATYSLVIIVMAWQGICLAVKSTAPRSSLLAAGALLFMFSDSMIALNKFLAPFELSVLVILASYWLSLTLILNAMLSIGFETKQSEGSDDSVETTS